MPLQNRVDPFGQLHASPARGLFTGNRGIIHDPRTRTLTGRRWTTKSWIICTCAFKGRHRAVWGYNGRTGGLGWTELFFLDEVTALAAGHRPCFECRREAAKAYADAFSAGNGAIDARVKVMDEGLHSERSAATRKVRTISHEDVAALPDGAMIADVGSAYAIRGRRARSWSFEGYGKPVNIQALSGELSLITPPVTVAALAAGFGPVWHPSAG